MTDTLHSLSVYEEILAHTNLNMMTKLTDNVKPATKYWDNAEKRSEAFCNAWIGATEAALVERKERKIFISDLH
tara:strand:- start:2019 stop:2240 length:222 start_codon:yes stop_codon:yes gene_type:complete